MNTEILNKVEKNYIRKDLPNFKVGDIVEVDVIIREGDKKRIQKFKGLVISISGSGTKKMFTVRKISYGVGVEKIFPLNSTNIAGITVIKNGKGRRSKLYYLRQRVGKLALKVKPGKPAPVIEHEEEAQSEEVEPTEIFEEQVEAVEAPEETVEVTPEEDSKE